MNRIGLIALAIVLARLPDPAWAVELVQVVSREDPGFQINTSRLAVGRDGRVYLSGGDYVLSVNRGGTGKRGGKGGPALWAAAANADGVVATANGHFTHSVIMRSPRFDELGRVDAFRVGDDVEYFAPCDVQVGASGDFYGIDLNRNRIVRVQAPDRLVTTYPLDAMGESLLRKMALFRVWEPGKRFYISCPSGTLRVVGFDGKPLWSLKGGALGNPWDGWQGGFDVDDAGRLYVLDNAADVVKILDADGKAAGEIALKMGERKGRVSDLRVWGDDILVRRPHASEMFQVYDRKTGELRRVVRADVEVLKVQYEREVWQAGQPTPLAIHFDPGSRKTAPRWRVWLRLLHDDRFTELPLAEGKVTPPADAGGLFHLRVCPDVEGAACEYQVDSVIEVRQPDARGSVSIWTPANRVYYGQREKIPVTVLARTQDKAFPGKLVIQLRDGKKVVAEESLACRPNEPARLDIVSGVAQLLKPGRYLLTTDLPGHTIAGQVLEIGEGLREPVPFSITQHGDYQLAFPEGNHFDVPGKVADHLARSRKLGLNQFVDRLGHDGSGALGRVGQTLTPPGLLERLQKDPLAVAPDKATIEGAVRRTIAGYGASGIEQRAILLYMDAGLPVGTGFDARKPEQFAEAITRVTKELEPYPAFRGWSWAANWWIGQLGAAAAPTPEKKKAYEDALKRARETGKWDLVLDEVSDLMFSHAVKGEQQFRSALDKTGLKKISAMTAPYRAVGAHPPIIFRNADEVDLHYQGEQIQPPQVTPHHVDFYKRPGKRAWGHPELWNDDGTGGMIFPTVMQMVMRGADGVGVSGDPRGWSSQPSDPRATAPGTLSIHRNLNELLRAYGPWLTTLKNADRVAIVVSTRMMRIDDWSKIGGKYFDRLFEAYNACLYAHRPARFVFVEDISAESFAGCHAVLVVGQQVELDPPMADALARARQAGVSIFHDATCRAELVKNFTPLGVAFDRVEKDPSAWQDDAAYERFPRYFRDHAAVLQKVLAFVLPVAQVDDPDVLLTERTGEAGRFLWAVNNCSLGLEPGDAWRVGLLMSQRPPRKVVLGIGDTKEAVYDVFAHRRVDLARGPIAADLTSLPARLFAVLPKPIGAVLLTLPEKLSRHGKAECQVTVLDEAGKPHAAALPVRIRVTARDGIVLAERHGVSTAKRAFVHHFPSWWYASGPLTIEAMEQVSGRSTTATLEIPTEKAPRPLLDEPIRRLGHDTFRGSRGSQPSPGAACDCQFGAHLKDIALDLGGRTALVNAMNWGDNTIVLDLEEGKVVSRQRIGHHFTYHPQTVTGGFAIQGFDLNTPEGYHLYRLDHGAKPAQRSALYGLPKRAVSWANGGQLLDRVNQFAVAPNDDWIASAGDLGLAVWDKGGKLLWSQDWWQTDRRRVVLLAADRETLVVLAGNKATAYDGASGKVRWQLDLPGPLTDAVAAVDGRVLAIRSEEIGGRVLIIREGKWINTLPTAADAMALAPDGKHLAATTGRQLKWYNIDTGLLWSFTGDEVLRNPRISGDGSRIAVTSELGTLYVLGKAGDIQQRLDLKALACPAWLPGGDLVAVTWMGAVVRFDREFKERWRLHIPASSDDIRPQLRAADATPTVRRAGWGNSEAKPLPLDDNLLKKTSAIISVTMSGRPQELQNPPGLLVDGKPDAPPKPWSGWTTINYIDSGWHGPLHLNIDTFRSQLRVTGITFVEDPSHPESWLRDVRLQYWDAVTEVWRDGPLLLSDAAIHSHRLAQPIEAARFRFVSTGGGTWPSGNIRLGELVFHGEVLGASHPDVVARKPVAVLFDEKEDDLKCLHYPGRPFEISPKGAYSGGKCLALTAAGNTGAAWQAPFGHAVPNWDFEIVEKPQAGQYRWLQFAWKAGSPKTTGISLLIGGPWPSGGYNLFAGQHEWREGFFAQKKVADQVPGDWQVVRVDLWELHKKPVRIQSLSLMALGDGALFDQILLGRTAEDLKVVQPQK